MKAAVRYYSRGGNIKAMAEAFARGAGVGALSIDSPGAKITEDVEILFIGGALYGYQLDRALKDYIASIPEGLVGRAVCFGSSYLTRRPVYLIQGLLKERGIAIAPQAVYGRNKPKQSLLDAIEYFASTEVKRDTSLDGLSPFERIRATQIAAGVKKLREDDDDPKDSEDQPQEPVEEETDSQHVSETEASHADDAPTTPDDESVTSEDA